MTDVTRILQAIEDGDPKAGDELLPLVYAELRQLATRRLSQERPGQTLQATALVHEAWIKLAGAEGARWDSRGHFFAAAAEAMRRILINRARDKGRLKRGGGQDRIDLDKIQLALDTPDAELVALHEALEELGQVDAESAKLVELRFFAGLSHGEAARALGIPRRTADRYWAYARAWLASRLSE
ncbi:MAG: ECF-type sigma factor [bacterium]|nr:ECF-type sigma factor [bacterium]